ncbi:hypothetical protein N0V94_008153 [Neodidymelliopsis sp. IMI 364377]|nr:hypothetical protein N0V94_008153 [Neodidymelliopsis sp. IMI 364377]
MGDISQAAPRAAVPKEEVSDSLPTSPTEPAAGLLSVAAHSRIVDHMHEINMSPSLAADEQSLRQPSISSMAAAAGYGEEARTERQIPASRGKGKGRAIQRRAPADNGEGPSSPHVPRITFTPASGVGEISMYPEQRNLYPMIRNAQRSIYRKGFPAHRKRVPVPRPQNVPQPRSIMKYAGVPLYRLCATAPYILGPMVLVSRLQVIVEKKIKPPIEVQRLVTTHGLGLAMLSGYDAALLTILGCLWND